MNQVLGKTFPICGVKNGNFVFIGTGSYIDTLGGFITAKHVLENNDLDEGSKYFMIHPEGKHRVVEHIYMHDIQDIALGKPHEEVAYNDAWFYTEKFPVLGEKIVGFGYPDSYLSETKPNVMKFRLGRYDGKVTEICQDCPSALIKGVCYRTDMHIKSGASGGPVINLHGQLIGVMSSSYDPYLDEPAVGFITPLRYLAEILVESEGEKIPFGKLMFPEKI